jgi:hypothetical protein
MRTSVVAGSLLSGALLFSHPAHAQQVSANVRVRSGPVTGHVAIGEYSTYRRPVARRVVVVERYAPRVIVVERVHHRKLRHWRHLGYRTVTVYYMNGRYYDRYMGRRPGLREIVVYERDGRYYRDDCDDDYRSHDDDHRYDRDRDHWDD